MSLIVISDAFFLGTVANLEKSSENLKGFPISVSPLKNKFNAFKKVSPRPYPY